MRTAAILCLLLAGCQTQGPQIRVEIRDSPGARVAVEGVETLIEGEQDRTTTPTTSLEVPLP